MILGSTWHDYDWQIPSSSPCSFLPFSIMLSAFHTYGRHDDPCNEINLSFSHTSISKSIQLLLSRQAQCVSAHERSNRKCLSRNEDSNKNAIDKKDMKPEFGVFEKHPRNTAEMKNCVKMSNCLGHESMRKKLPPTWTLAAAGYYSKTKMRFAVIHAALASVSGSAVYSGTCSSTKRASSLRYRSGRLLILT